jgi:Lrp/AsnC family transcriptional regulator, leucine-responsive regulatory protein
LRTLPEIVECDRVTGEDCFVARAHLKSIEDLERLIDRIIPHAMTATSIIQSTLIKRRPPPIVANADESAERVAAGRR